MLKAKKRFSLINLELFFQQWQEIIVLSYSDSITHTQKKPVANCIFQRWPPPCPLCTCFSIIWLCHSPFEVWSLTPLPLTLGWPYDLHVTNTMQQNWCSMTSKASSEEATELLCSFGMLSLGKASHCVGSVTNPRPLWRHSGWPTKLRSACQPSHVRGTWAKLDWTL